MRGFLENIYGSYYTDITRRGESETTFDMLGWVREFVQRARGIGKPATFQRVAGAGVQGSGAA